MEEPAYGNVKSVRYRFDEAVSRVKAELQGEGFGVLTEIDLQAAFRKKLDQEFRPYTILGACNPTLASKALAIEPEIGLLLPCNVVVQETPTGEVTVGIASPGAMFALVDNPGIREVVEEAAERLDRVLEAL